MHDRKAGYYFSIHPEDYAVCDPRVYAGSGKSTASSLESATLSALVLRTACLNSTALLPHGTADIREPQLEKILYMFDPVGESADKYDHVLRRGRFVVRAKRKYYGYDYYTLTVASKSGEDLAAELKRLDVSFEVSPPQDLGPKVRPNWEWYAGYPH